MSSEYAGRAGSGGDDWVVSVLCHCLSICLIVKCGCVCAQHDFAHIIGVRLTVMVPVGLYTVCVIGLRVRSGGGISEHDVAVRSRLSAAVSRQKSRPVRGGGAG